MKTDINEQLDRAREFAGDTASAATEKLKGARDSAAETFSRSKEKATIVYGDARDRSYRAAGRANEFIQEHPIAATAAAVAAGAVLAVLFPKGRALVRSGTGAIAAFGAKAGEAATLAVEVLEQHAEDARAAAKRAAIDARSLVGSAASDAKSSLGSARSRAAGFTDSAASLADSAVSRAKDAVTAATDRLRK
ncbi:MAG: hypothetical protein ACSLE1_05435 [Sphingobium sp.]